MNGILVVLRKELRDGRRDYRAVFSALLFPFLGPALVYFMMTMMIEVQNRTEKTLLPTIGAERAPDLLRWLAEYGVTVVPFTGDPQAAVAGREQDLVMIIPENYGERLSQGRTVAIEMVIDGSRQDLAALYGKMRYLIGHYGSEIAGLRLIARGISPELMMPVRAEEVDVASRQERTATALNFIPMYIILAAFVAGMGIAVDSTAGERERRSLEALLINPVPHRQLITGKWLAASTFALTGMSLTTVLCMLAMARVPLEDVGLALTITPTIVLAMILAAFPLAFLATSLQLLLGLFAKSFKDAQSYIGLLIVLPMVPSFYLMFNPVATQDWMFAVPLLAQQLMLVEIIGGSELVPLRLGLSIVTCLLAGALVAVFTSRLLSSERIITQS